MQTQSPETKLKRSSKRWRDVICVHPAAELFPALSEEEFTALVVDIDRNGVQQNPVTVTIDGKHWLVDGRNRLDALERLGYRFGIEDRGLTARRTGSQSVWAENRLRDPWDLAVSLNVHRRHLTQAQR